MQNKGLRRLFLLGNMNGGYVPDDARSHISQMSTRSRARSMADGRSEHGLFSYQAKYNSSRPGKKQIFVLVVEIFFSFIVFWKLK